MEDLELFCEAAKSFGLEYFETLANEDSYQAWFANELINVFGKNPKRVYRDVHFYANNIRVSLEYERKDHFPQTFKELNTLCNGDHLSPDFVISDKQFVDVDARYSGTRECTLFEKVDETKKNKQNADLELLAKLSIVSEFKVTGSVKKITPSRIKQDLLKLVLLSSTFGKVRERLELANFKIASNIIPIMFILDNNRNSNFNDDTIRNILSNFLKANNEIMKNNSFIFPSMYIIHKTNLLTAIAATLWSYNGKEYEKSKIEIIKEVN